MKKLCTRFIVVLCVASFVQLASAQGLSLGIKAGVGLSSYVGNTGIRLPEGFGRISTEEIGETSTEEGEDGNNRTTVETITKATDIDPGPVLGFYVGVTSNIAISDKFSVQPELLFAMQGGTKTIENDHTVRLTPPVDIGEDSTQNSTSIYTYNIGYFKIPVLLKFYLMGEVGNGFSLSVGPQVSFKVSNSGTVKEGRVRVSKDDTGFTVAAKDGTEEEALEADFFEPLHNTRNRVSLLNHEIGFIVGIDYDLHFGVSLGLRYDIGLTNAFYTSLQAYENTTLKNSTLSLSVAYSCVR